MSWRIVCRQMVALIIKHNYPGVANNMPSAYSAFQQVSSGNGSSLVKNVTQTSHGFSVGNWVYRASGAFVLARGDSAADAESAGVVSAVADANNFTITLYGDSGAIFTGLVDGEVYFLDPATPGGITETNPSTPGQVSKPVLKAYSSTAGFVCDMRGELIGGASSGGGPEPGPPSSLTATGGNGQVTLSWTPPTFAVSGFNVYNSVDSDMSSPTLATNTSSSSATVTGLTNGTTYYFAVTSVSSTGRESVYSNGSSATPIDYLLKDDWTANLGDLSGRAVESGSATPTNWVVDSGSWTVSSGYVSLGGTTADAVAYAESGEADVTVGSTITAPAGSTINGIAFRWSSSGNFWTFYIEDDGGTPYVVLAKFVGGAHTGVGSANTTSGSHTLTVVCSGDSITCYLDGAKVLSTTDSTYATATKHGLLGYTASGYGFGENTLFRVTAP